MLINFKIEHFNRILEHLFLSILAPNRETQIFLKLMQKKKIILNYFVVQSFHFKFKTETLHRRTKLRLEEQRYTVRNTKLREEALNCGYEEQR